MVQLFDTVYITTSYGMGLDLAISRSIIQGAWPLPLQTADPHAFDNPTVGHQEHDQERQRAQHRAGHDPYDPAA
jgi:hypothetical protein